MPSKLPALDLAVINELRGSTFRSRSSQAGDRMKKRLGDACGLSQTGVNLVTPGSGGQSALHHWHTPEDGFVYVLSGEVVLITDEGGQLLHAGMCAGYAAGSGNAHRFINRSAKPAQYLETGGRIADDQAHCPDGDLPWVGQETKKPDGYGKKTTIAARKDGRHY